VKKSLSLYKLLDNFRKNELPKANVPGFCVSSYFGSIPGQKTGGIGVIVIPEKCEDGTLADEVRAKTPDAVIEKVRNQLTKEYEGTQVVVMKYSRKLPLGQFYSA